MTRCVDRIEGERIKGRKNEWMERREGKEGRKGRKRRMDKCMMEEEGRKNKGRKEWREERKMSGCVDERDGERIKGRKD